MEELGKMDVLCSSTERFDTSQSFNGSAKDNINQFVGTMVDMSAFM